MLTEKQNSELIDDMPEANSTYYLAAFPAVTMRLTETCHDMGMRAYFQWKGYSQERAEQEYDIAYFSTLRKFSPNHPHLKYAPEAE